MTQKQFDIVKAIDEKCGGNVLLGLTIKSERVGQPWCVVALEGKQCLCCVGEDAIAFRLMVEMAHRFHEPSICFYDHDDRQRWWASDWDETKNEGMGDMPTRIESGPTAFAAVLALAANVFGVEAAE